MGDLRMPDLNRVHCAGRLTRDPDLRYTSNNVAFCKFGLAVSRTFTSKGEKREDTIFVNVTAWEKAAEYIGEHLRKGACVLVEGRLTMSEWDDKATGQKRRLIEVRADRVQSLEWTDRGPVSNGQGRREAAQGKPASERARGAHDAAAGEQDDIPF